MFESNLQIRISILSNQINFKSRPTRANGDFDVRNLLNSDCMFYLRISGDGTAWPNTSIIQLL